MRIRLRHAALAAAATACAVAFIVAGACIAVPPAELPPQGAQRPTILRTAVQPPPDQPLLEWPDAGFLVPVQLQDTSDSFQWDVFVDYRPDVSNMFNPVPQLGPTVGPSSALDGGVVMVTIPLQPTDLDLHRCHSIEILVANGFAQTPGGQQAFHVFNSVGGDSVSWTYLGPAGWSGCLEYDAGDGTFPDASSDAPPDTTLQISGDP